MDIRRRSLVAFEHHFQLLHEALALRAHVLADLFRELLEELALLRGQRDGHLDVHFDLLIAGPAGWGSDSVIARLRQGIDGVEYLGYVPEKDMPAVTAGAAAFVYPSLYEGFGFPVAQAMAAGVPVITSNTSCLPEVAGAGALFVDPKSTSELRTALERLLDSETLRQELGAQGRVQAARYRWDECARKSLEFFRSLYE